MKLLLSVIFLTAMSVWVTRSISHQNPVKSTVYQWAGSTHEGVHNILAGSTTALGDIRVDAHTLASEKASVLTSQTEEQLILMKMGTVAVHVNDEVHQLGRGSVVVVMPGDAIEIRNEANEPAEFYTFTYAARTKPHADATISYVVDWEDVEFKPHDKGGRRDFFDRPTASFRRFEMHVTTLNEGLQSHPAHTHKAEEFILIMQGDVEEEIDGKFERATAGDLIFLDSMVPHGITNVGQGPAIYFAFQWE